MKAKIFVLFLLISSSAFSQQKTANTQHLTTPQKLDYFLKLTDTLRQKGNNPGLAMAILVNGEMIYKGGMGFRDLENELPVTEQTLFEIGSLTKAFTGVIASQLVEEGFMQWDDPLRKHLKEFQLADEYATQHATFKDLYTHRVGLVQHYYLMFGPQFSRDEMLEKISHLGFAATFREKFLYNNFMYTVAGIAQERMTGKTWEELIEQRIFQPLGMGNSFAAYQQGKHYTNVALAYQNNGKTLVAKDSSNVFAPAGSATTSTIEDMSIWLEMLMNAGKIHDQEFLSPKQFGYLTSPHTVRTAAEQRFYGIGWDVSTKDGYTTIFHDGRTSGQSSRIVFIPELDFGIVILSNQRSDLQNLLTHYAVNFFINNDFSRNTGGDAWIENQANKAKASTPVEEYSINDPKIIEKLEAYTGTYQHPVYGEIQIKTGAGNQLLFQYYDFKGSLQYYQKQNFTAHTQHPTGKNEFKLSFAESTEGKINQVKVSIPYTPVLVFKKELAGNSNG
jgi:CubicO group peptidase (beta-lactamase class C family)